MMTITTLFTLLIIVNLDNVSATGVPAIVDLHSHSTWSDGADTAEMVVRKAGDKNIKILALTDHDQLSDASMTVDAFQAAADSGIELKIGTEISCEWAYHNTDKTKRKDSKVHLLGYFPDPKNRPLQKALNQVRVGREKRNLKIESVLKDRFKLPITLDDALEQAGGETTTLGRPHFAKALLKKGLVSDIKDAFNKYLSDENLQLDPWALDMRDAIRLVDGAGGVAVLAHAVTLKIPFDALEAELTYLLRVEKVPLRGIEVFSSRHSEDDVKSLKKIAKKLGLLITGGSDYHGANKVNVPLGEFGGGDAAWRAEGFDAFAKLQQAASRRGHDVDGIARSGVRGAVSSVISYFCLFFSILVLSQFIRRRADTADATSDWLLGFLVRHPFLHRVFLGRCGGEDVVEDDGDGEGNSRGDHGETDGLISACYNTIIRSDTLTLIVCVTGLQISYVSWGVLQERIMQHDYNHGNGTSARFTRSEFLVFMNRLSALIVATVAMRMKKVGKAFCPYYMYSYAAMSNILSSFFQYEALKFITFPLQVLSKSSKITFTMLMGRVISGKRYSWKDYLVGVLIAIGLVIFKLGGKGGGSGDDDKEFGLMFMVGIGMIGCYIGFDAFTSQWQGHIFEAHKVSPFQMMQGVNGSSVPIIVLMMTVNGGFFESIAFMTSYPECLFHATIMSLCSAVGQVFIYTTIERYGPVIFSMVMTCRQLFSIIVSMFLYGHRFTSSGYVGLTVIFGALLFKIKIGADKKRAAKAAVVAESAAAPAEAAMEDRKTLLDKGRARS